MNQSTIQPPAFIPEPVVPIEPKRSFPKWPLIALFSFFLGIASVLTWQKLQPTGFNPAGQSPLISPEPTAEAENPTDDWQIYTNEQYGFSIKYFPESMPQEIIGNEDSGQFANLLLIKFGSNSLKFPYGYEIALSKKPKSIDEFRTELIGHIADKIDSEEELKLNGNTWKKINYQIFLVTDNVPVTTAIIENKEFSYAITASAVDIDQILSTFKFIDTNQVVCQASSDCPAGYFCNTFDQTCNQALPD